MNENSILDTITTIALQFDEIPIIRPGAVVWEITDPDGAAGACGASSRGEITLTLTRWVFGEDVSEERFEEGRTAADETGVDFNHTVKKS